MHTEVCTGLDIARALPIDVWLYHATGGLHIVFEDFV